MVVFNGGSRANAPGYTSGKPPALAELPPFPVVAIRALQMVWNSEASLRELHDVIRTDQAFSVELLRIANCPLYGIRSQIKSTMQATILLGFERVKAVVLTIGMRSYLGSCLKIPALKACWRHSLACAMITEELAKVNFLGARLGGYEGLLASPQESIFPQQTAVFNPKVAASAILDKDMAYTAGMIHDVGRLALAASRPQQYAEMLRTAGDGSRDMLQREREAFGMDHTEMGHALAQAWNLPAELDEVISGHHAPVIVNRFDLLAAVQLACRMADTLGFDAGGAANPMNYEELIGGLPERERMHFDCDPEELARAVEAKISSIEPV
jgi:HD-like signal output (HDOD) protein